MLSVPLRTEAQLYTECTKHAIGHVLGQHRLPPGNPADPFCYTGFHLLVSAKLAEEDGHENLNKWCMVHTLQRQGYGNTLFRVLEVGLAEAPAMRKNPMVVQDVTAKSLAGFNRRCMDKPHSDLSCGDVCARRGMM